jgi:TolA-binding protein
MIPAGVEFGDELIPSPPFLLPRQQELSPTTAKAVARLRSGIRPAPAPSPSPVILEEERSGQARGEDTILANVVQSSFATKNYADAEDKLLRFLRIQREGRAEARAHFYLGQIYFFQGDAQSAFLSFLLANDAYYEATQPWLDACFAALS